LSPDAEQKIHCEFFYFILNLFCSLIAKFQKYIIFNKNLLLCFNSGIITQEQLQILFYVYVNIMLDKLLIIHCSIFIFWYKTYIINKTIIVYNDNTIDCMQVFKK